MQAWADAAAVSETLQSGLATFYSRSRKERWCKGETSGNFIRVRTVNIFRIAGNLTCSPCSWQS
jgi:phosphoribosyl-AMP cyclohydrolase / phosphoribosyl-ATP pyrophosphohydrolase